MAIAHRNTTTVSYAAGSSVVLSKPTGTAENDILFVQIYIEDTARTITPPSGWAELTIQDYLSSGGYRVHTLWKRATASEGTSYTFTLSGSSARSAFCSAYSGCTTSGNPFEGENLADYEYTGWTFQSVSSTTDNDGAMLIYGCANYPCSAVLPPSGWTEAADISSIETAYYIQASAGPTGNIYSPTTSTYTCSSSLAIMIPAGAGGPTGNPWYYYAQQLRSLKDKLRGLLQIPSLEEVKLYGRLKIV